MTDVAGLEKLAPQIEGGKGHTPLFVGREAELERVERNLLSEPREKAEGRTNGMLVFSGPPGAGKSALLVEAGKRAASGEGKKPLVVRTTPPQLRSDDGLLGLIYREAKSVSRRKEGILKVLGTGADILLTYTTGLRTNLTDVFARIGELAPEERPHVLLMIDEAQNSTKANLDVYLSLSQSDYPLPITTVLAGLSDTNDALESAGLSRIGDKRHIRLGLLEPEECECAMETLLRQYAIRTAKPEEWLELARDESSLFPKHLHSAIYATVEVAIGKNGAELAADDLEEARRLARENRADYYESRASEFPDTERWLATAVISTIAGTGTDPAGAVEEILEQQTSNPDRSIQRLRRKVDPDEFARKMIHKGMLERGEGNVYHAPIPSFAAWLDENYGHIAAAGPH